MKKAKFLNLNWKDFTKGAILAIIIAVMTFLQGLASTDIDWKKLVIAVIIAFLGYLVKNAFTNSNDQFLKKE